LQGIVGVRHHDVNIGTGELHIDLSPTGRPSLAVLANAVREAGFTVLDVEVRP